MIRVWGVSVFEFGPKTDCPDTGL